MFSQLAQVFSSQGVVLYGTERIPVYRKKAVPEPPCDHKGNCSCFAPKFEQASARLELSKQAKSRMADGKPLSDEDQKQVKELEKRDREVKAHEAAHSASAGGNARGGASYDYQTGPDGRQYAVGGHVDIDVSPVQGNPRATLEKAQTVQHAALAPADPSGQDRAVAAAAAQMALQAQSEVAHESALGGSGPGKGGPEAGNRGSGEASTAVASATTGFDPRRAYGQPASRKGASVSVYA